VITAFWLIRTLLGANNGPPRWLYVVALPGMDSYRLLFPARSGYDGWLGALIVVSCASVFWSLVLVGVSDAARYAAVAWMGPAARDEPARALGAMATLKLFALVSALVTLVVLQVAGSEFASILWFDWFFFVMLPGDVANQLLPFAHYSGSAAIAFIDVSAAIAWTALLVVIDTLLRIRQRRRSRPIVA